MKSMIRIQFVFLFTVAMPIAICLSQESSPSGADATASVQASSAAAVDPVGTWVWEQSFGGNRGSRSVELQLQQGKLSGTYKPSLGNQGNLPPGFGDPLAIEDAKLEGDTVSFSVTRSFNGNQFKTRFWGIISGDEIAGITTVNFGGEDRESEWMASRVVDPTDPTDQTDQTDPTDKAAAAPTIPAAAWIPDPGAQTDEPYAPRPILPGGIVMPLYSPDSPYLKADRIKEPEKFNLSTDVPGRINSIVNIHNPSIEVHFASPSMNTGAVVILAAGGGHRTLNVGSESADFVPFFYNYGVNTVILRNRLRSDGYEPTTDAVRDALQSIRLVRKFADQWKFDPNKIGIMGFSAGAELSAPAAIDFETFDQENRDPNDPLAGVSSRPDFVGIIYPGPTPFTRQPDREFPRNAPPAFITCPGAGDQVHAIWATEYFVPMLRAGVPNVEMHIYGNGYHPGDRGSSGGMTHRKGIPFGTWHHRFIDWFDDLGFLGPPGEETKAAIDSREFVSQPPRRSFNRGQNRGDRQPGANPQPSASAQPANPQSGANPQPSASP